jgi:hypothetical protein
MVIMAVPALSVFYRHFALQLDWRARVMLGADGRVIKGMKKAENNAIKGSSSREYL